LEISDNAIVVLNYYLGWEGHVARMGGKMNAYRILVGKSEGKRPLGRHKMDLREIEWSDVD
jgi:hypothetical protein